MSVRIGWAVVDNRAEIIKKNVIITLRDITLTIDSFFMIYGNMVIMKISEG